MKKRVAICSAIGLLIMVAVGVVLSNDGWLGPARVLAFGVLELATISVGIVAPSALSLPVVYFVGWVMWSAFVLAVWSLAVTLSAKRAPS